MPKNTPKKLPENLRDFAQLAGISDESLVQILDNLKQANIDIKDPDEKLSSKTKVKLLAFFKGKITNPQGPKQTRVSKLKGSLGSSKSVMITRVTRKVTEEKLEPEPEPETSFQETEALNTPIATENPSEELDTHITDEQTSELLNKKEKAAHLKKKEKLEVPLKTTKRNKRIPDSFEDSVFEEDEDIDTEAVTGIEITQKNKQKKTSLKQTFKKPAQKIKRVIWIPEQLTIVDLAKKMSMKDIEVIKHLGTLGVKVEYSDDLIDQDTARLFVEEMGHEPRLLLHNAEELALRESIEQQMGEPQQRPPIITIMGHVDHGKTSLLDYIRREKVASSEAGGITQHIGAYHVELPKGVITFLDTPGHAAFTAMRARGARLTDIVALVVAADDGVMPQTQEAVEHAQAANVPIVVVVNKIDKPGASMELTQQGLSKYNLIPEDWGGETLFVGVSAKSGEGVDNLLDMLLLQAEMSELASPTKGPAQGIIIESRLDKGRGPVATMIIQKGTLKKGDVLLAGTSFGKIRLLTDETGKTITSATPSIPVEVLGLSTPPLAGEEAIVVPNERKAREIAQIRANQARISQNQIKSHDAFDTLADPFKAKTQKTIQIIIKADVQGSAEALKEALVKLSTEEVTLKPLMTGVGILTESDVNLAIASKAIIFGFNINIDNVAKRLIQQEKVTIYQHSIIYELLDEAKKLVKGLAEPQIKETVTGKALVQKTFKSGKTSIIAGCVVTEGSIHINHNLRVLRNNTVIHQGKAQSLRRFKDDVKEANTGVECGISFKSYTDLAQGDIIESYERTSTTQ